MKKYLGSILKFVISLGLGIGLVYWSLKGVTPEQRQMISDSFERAKFGWLGLLIFFGLLSNFFRAQRWRLLLKPLGYTPDYWNTFASIMIMFFANLAFPRLGEVLRCSVLARYEKVPVEKSIGTMVLERVVDLVSILILGGIVLLFEYQRYYSFIKDMFKGFDPMKYLMILTIVIFGGLILYYISRRKKVSKKDNIVIVKLGGLWQGIVSIKDLDRKWEFLFHTICIWICYIAMPYFGFKCLAETAHLGWVAAMASVFFGGFAMVATQGGIGAFQIVTQKVLATYGIADIIGLSYGWISWSTQTVFVIAGGILSLVFLVLYNKDESNKETHVAI